MTAILRDYILPVNHKCLLEMGFTYHVCSYYCPPDLHGGVYRLKKETETWRAFLPYGEDPTIRTFENVQELNLFHIGMGGKQLLL